MGQTYLTEPYASYLTNANIKKQWAEGYRITEVSSGNRLWWVVMHKETASKQQTYNMTQRFPTGWVTTKSAEEYRVTALASANG